MEILEMSVRDVNWSYSLNKKEWICSLFKEWILYKSEVRVNLEWTLVLFTNFGVTGITQGFRVIPEVTPKWVNNTNVHSKFTLISLFSKIHSLKSEHIHSFLFRECTLIDWLDIMQKVLTEDEIEMSIGTFQASWDEFEVQILYRIEWQWWK